MVQDGSTSAQASSGQRVNTADIALRGAPAYSATNSLNNGLAGSANLMQNLHGAAQMAYIDPT